MSFYLSLGITCVCIFFIIRTYIKYSRKTYPPSKVEKIKQYKAIIKEMEEMRKEMEKEGFTSVMELLHIEMLYLLRQLNDQAAGTRSELRSLVILGIATTIGFGIAILNAL